MDGVSVKYEPTSNKVLFEFQASGQKDFMKKMSGICEITDNGKCGYKKADGKICGSNNISYRVRVVGKFTYYEKVCTTCGASFQFGQNQDGDTLFPKWEDGWKKFDKETNARVDGV